MFRETLLESSASGRKRKRWPMMVAFTLEVVVGVALIMLPLLSTGVIPVSAHLACPIAPLGRANATRPHDGGHRGTGVTSPQAVVMPIADLICVVCPQRDAISGPTSDNNDGPPNIGDPHGPPLLDAPPSHVVPEQPKQPERIRVSVISEGQLMNKVDPVYPRIAILSGVKGDVRLHAIIAKDGTIQSLTVVSGPPLLIAAARNAVSQWRYRPYLLNGQPVEVETFITVSFKGIRD